MSSKPLPFDSANPIACFGFDVPPWIESDISWDTVRDIVHGGCDSGAYMPAVTYHVALEVMSEHGDDILDYLDGDVPAFSDSTSWAGYACRILSAAVERWAMNIDDERRAAERDRESEIEQWEDEHGWEAPSDWVSYLINGDHSGLDEEDKRKADEFIDNVMKSEGNACFFDVVDRGFTMHGDYKGRDVSLYFLPNVDRVEIP